jgi:type I restriction enzyme S subunit
MTLKLSDIVERVCVGFVGSCNKDYTSQESGIPMIRTTNLTGNSILYEGLKFVTPDFHLKNKKSQLKRGDILVARHGHNGLPSIYESDENANCLNVVIIKIHDNKDYIDNYFILYALRTPYVINQVKAAVGGSVQGVVNTKAIADLDIPFPERSIRKKVVEQLRPLNKKIELNKQTNQTLEQMAQTLFKSWFVDFDPVFDNLLAKVDFKLESLASDFPESLLKRAQKRLLALDPQSKKALLSANSPSGSQSAEEASQTNIHKHFPSEFEHNEQLGWIPKGWEDTPVSKAIQVNPRTTLPKGIIAKFADMKSIPTSGYMVDEVIEKAFSGGAKFKKNDILLARITPCLQNGKTALVDFLEDDEVGFGSTEFIVLRENKSISYPFIACLAREENFRAHCMQSMVGSSGRQRVQNACFDDYYLALPKEDRLVKRFSELTKPNFINMTSNKLENQSLTNLRDTLLPKLISGEIKIKIEKVL